MFLFVYYMKSIVFCYFLLQLFELFVKNKRLINAEKYQSEIKNNKRIIMFELSVYMISMVE